MSEIKRDSLGRIAKGSGAINPGGRPRDIGRIRDYISGEDGIKTKADIDSIRAIAEDEDEPAFIRFKALTWLAEQVIGKAAQAITGDAGGPIQLDNMTNVEGLSDRIAAILAGRPKQD